MRSIVLMLLISGFHALAQESIPLSVEPTVPKAFLRETYHYQMKAHGGITPYQWQLTGGTVPQGISLEHDGLLSGTPTETGDFHFVVTVTDSAKPAHQINQEITVRVKAALLAEWKQPPQLDGSRLHGSVVVANGSDDEVELTVIVLAVNEIGKAFAAGYQHGPLAKDASIDVPFDDTLPNGSYVVNVDVVGEITDKNKIYRARLFSKSPMKAQAQ